MNVWPVVRCAGCKWWEGRHDLAHFTGDRREAPKLGFCRVNPPITDVKGYSWPVTRHADWCGRGEGRPAETLPDTLPETLPETLPDLPP